MSADSARSAVAGQLDELTAPGGALFGGYRDTVRALDSYTPAGFPTRTRLQLRHRIIDEYLARQDPVQRDGRAALLTAGPPGAGKTTTLGALDPAWRHLDADIVKEYLIVAAVDSRHYDDLLSRELVDGHPIMPAELASVTHIESLSILSDIRATCLQRGENVAIEGTLSWLPYGEELLDDLLAHGYRYLDIVDVEVSAETAREQVLHRWWTGRQGRITTGRGFGGRYVPRAVVDRVFPTTVDKRSICATNARTLFESNAAAELETVTLTVHDATSGSVTTSRQERHRRGAEARS